MTGTQSGGSPGPNYHGRNILEEMGFSESTHSEWYNESMKIINSVLGKGSYNGCRDDLVQDIFADDLCKFRAPLDDLPEALRQLRHYSFLRLHAIHHRKKHFQAWKRHSSNVDVQSLALPDNSLAAAQCDREDIECIFSCLQSDALSDRDVEYLK